MEKGKIINKASTLNNISLWLNFASELAYIPDRHFGSPNEIGYHKFRTSVTN